MSELETKKKKIASLKDQMGEYYDVMKAENLEELELKSADYFISLKRKGKKTNPQTLVYAHPAAQAAVPVNADADMAKQSNEIKGETVKSPIIGTFYRSPSPTSAPFVKEGDSADEGKTLCIVEAMKVMNEIKAEARIKILKILVVDGKPVTAGQDLFLIER